MLGFIQLSSPAEGSTVTSPVTIDGVGTAFEATINYDITSVDNGSSQSSRGVGGVTSAGANGEFGPFSVSVDLEPGTYVLRAFEASAKDGKPTHVDTKTFTVH